MPGPGRMLFGVKRKYAEFKPHIVEIGKLIEAKNLNLAHTKIRALKNQYKNYIIDLSDTLFLDSTFLGSIIVLLKRINQMDGTLRMVVIS